MPQVREGASSDRSGQDCGESAGKVDSIYRRIAWRVMPILIVGYIIAYLDRVNVGFAKLQMMDDLKFSDSVYGLGAGIFFLGYFLFEVPSNVILHRIGARVWICRLLVTWGIVSGCTALIRSAEGFYAMRFLLGIAESGFFPGVVLYLTYWFPSYRRAKMVAVLMAGNPIAGIVGGPISGYILHRFPRGHAIAGWQWLFILEAIPALIMGGIVLVLLDSRVADARWLSDEEKAVVSAEIGQEAGGKTHHTILSVFTSARVWLMCAILFGIVMGSYAIGFWQPTILHESGVRDPFKIGLLTAVPYLFALVTMIVAGQHSDKVRERRWHVAVPNLTAALGFLVCARAGGSTSIAMIGLTLAVCGVVTALPMFWALPTSFLGGTAAAAGIALVNSTGNLAGFCSPAIIGFMKDYTGTLNSGLFLVAACLAASALLILGLVPARTVNQ